MNQQEELNELQDIWKKKHLNKGYSRFIYDGIVDADIWNSQETPKICYFLKEAYSSDPDGYHMDKWLAENREPWKMWKKVAVWTKAIHCAFIGWQPFDSGVVSREAPALIHSIAAVNIKKSNGGSVSDYEDIWKYAREDKEEIYRELEIISPEIILCGYTLGCFKSIVGDEFVDMNTVDSMFGLWKDTLVIDYYHPACRYPNAVNYYALMAICQNAKKQGCCGKYEQRLAAQI